MKKQLQSNKSVVVNFGRPHKRPASIVINTPEAIDLCKDKILMKQKFTECGVPSPDWSFVANNTFTDYTGKVIYKPKYHSRGRGLVVFDSVQDCVDARQHETGTMEVFHNFTREYRVHIFAGHAINIDKKYLRDGFEEQEIRHKTHYRYSRVVKFPDDLISASVMAVDSLGLDFGAVDIGYDESENKCYVLEVNSAPGMRQSLVDRYLACIKAFVDDAVDTIPNIIEEFEIARRENIEE